MTSAHHLAAFVLLKHFAQARIARPFAMKAQTLTALTLLALLPAMAACSAAQAPATPTKAVNAVNAANAGSKALLPYPAAGKNQTRWVISPDAIAAQTKNADADTVRVEIIVGKTMQVDCNRHFLTGTLQEETLQGWGYTYYQFQSSGHAGSTRMACPPASRPSTAFVAAPGITVAYNPKLPLVIYTPQGYSVQYRLWQATPTLLPAAASE